MEDWEELESWHEDLNGWESFQDELERINGCQTDNSQSNDSESIPLRQENLKTFDTEHIHDSVKQIQGQGYFSESTISVLFVPLLDMKVVNEMALSASKQIMVALYAEKLARMVLRGEDPRKGVV